MPKEIYILPQKAVEEIKNPYIIGGIYGGGLKTVRRDDNGKLMTKQADYFQEGVNAVLALVQKVDLDKELDIWLDKQIANRDKKIFLSGRGFSEYLQSRLPHGKEGKRE